jgi:adenylate cyclase
MGYGPATNLTAVGDTLNTASRLEGVAKDLDAELVISDDVARLAALDLTGMERKTLTMRGRSEMIAIWIVPSAGELAPRIPGEIAVSGRKSPSLES